MLPDGDVGIGGPLRHSCEALDSRRARQTSLNGGIFLDIFVFIESPH